MGKEAVEGVVILRGVAQSEVMLIAGEDANALLHCVVELLPSVSGDVGNDHDACCEASRSAGLPLLARFVYRSSRSHPHREGCDGTVRLPCAGCRRT